MEVQMKSFVIALTVVFAFAAAPLALEAATATGTNTGIGQKQPPGDYVKGKTSAHNKQVDPSDNSTDKEVR